MSLELACSVRQSTERLTQQIDQSTAQWINCLRYVQSVSMPDQISEAALLAQELNSVEAIKGAVQHGLGVAFVSVTAIQKELDLGLASRVSINGVRLFRTLRLVSNPRRDYSRIARKFMVDVFGMVNMDSFIGQRQGNGEKVAAPLPHVIPAARPWENAPGANGASVPKPILQQAQNLNGTSAHKSHQPRSSG